ncbi:uncharacterized protein [Erythrolamprus reginae]|uniref:uncharacterized protein n=1 Tax=Erythrolamprus reginae TaxID=121349 RepID=UPI00396C7EBC
MERPRKNSGWAASPRPADPAPQAGPRTPRSSARYTTITTVYAYPTAPAPKSRGGRGSGPEEEIYYDGQPRGPRRSYGWGGEKASGISYAAGVLPRPFSREKVAMIEKETRGQWSNPKWHEWRKNRITASVAGAIAKSRFANGRTLDVPQYYLKKVVGLHSRIRSQATNWGIENEKNAVKAYTKRKSRMERKQVYVKDCGLFVDKKHPWLAASPDGIVVDAYTNEILCLLEVKCPYNYRNMTVSEACQDKNFCLETDGGFYWLKTTHPHYTQVQVQMKTSGVHNIDFVVYTKCDIVIVPVEFDLIFWTQTLPKLKKFYVDAVIPYLEEKNSPPACWDYEE